VYTLKGVSTRFEAGKVITTFAKGFGKISKVEYLHGSLIVKVSVSVLSG